MKRWQKWGIGLVVAALLLAAVARTLEARRVQQASATASKTQAAFDLSAADVIVASERELVRTLPVSGGLKAVNTALVKARVSAQLQSLTVREGDSVRAGQAIGQLDTVELTLRLRQAEQSAGQARAQRDITARTLENNRALVAQGFISTNGLETSISNEAAASATYRAALAAADIARKAIADARLVAPISGLISQRFAQPGERVSLDARIVEIVDLSRLELEAAVAPEDVIGMRVGQSARLVVDGADTPMPATVARINPSTQAGTRSVMVYLQVEPQPGLRQGLFAKGDIALETRPALVAPVSAVRIDQARPYVLAVEDGKVVRKTVSLGARGEVLNGGTREAVVELLDGVTAGDTLLRGSVGAVREGTAVNLATGAPAAR